MDEPPEVRLHHPCKMMEHLPLVASYFKMAILCVFPVDIPMPDYDRTDDATNGEPPQVSNQTSNKYRLTVEDSSTPSVVKMAAKQEEEVVVAQPVVEGDRSKAGAKRRSQMQVVSIRLDSDSDSNSGRK